MVERTERKNGEHGRIAVFHVIHTGNATFCARDRRLPWNVVGSWLRVWSGKMRRKTKNSWEVETTTIDRLIEIDQWNGTDFRRFNWCRCRRRRVIGETNNETTKTGQQVFGVTVLQFLVSTNFSKNTDLNPKPLKPLFYCAILNDRDRKRIIHKPPQDSIASSPWKHWERGFLSISHHYTEIVASDSSPHLYHIFNRSPTLLPPLNACKLYNTVWSWTHNLDYRNWAARNFHDRDNTML